MLDFSAYLEPLTESDPCGPDCEYDNDFLALTQEAAGKPEQQFGDTVIPAVEPDWRAVDSQARELLGRTRDLRVVALLTLANTHLHGVTAFAAGLRLAAELCERYWDQVHPRIEVDGDSDPYLRSNALTAFAGSEFSGEDRILQALRASTLLPPPLSATYREVEAVYARPQEATYTAAQIDTAIADGLGAGHEALSAVVAAHETATQLMSFLSDRLSIEDRPDLDRLLETLKPVANAVRRMQNAVTGDSPGAEATAEGGGAAAATAVAFNAGVITSRDDARRALERVCEYLERAEPSNPASLFARRAQRMLSMTFFEIMQELNPDSMSHLEMITGARAPSNDS